jgi:UDP-N-acetylglucosamine:LPS N-acetylglucosamine transferase
VLFLLSDTASGHRSVADAIAHSLDAVSDGHVDHEVADLFVAARLPVLRSAGAIYQLFASRFEWAYNVGFEVSNSALFMRVSSRWLFRIWRSRLEEVLGSFRASVVVVDHPFFVGAMVDLSRRYFGLDFKIVTVVTDLVSPHASWAWPGVDLFLVPTPEVYGRLERLGVEASKLRYVDFPVHSDFSPSRLTRSAARRQLGIPEDRFTALVTGGGDGLGRLVPVVETLVSQLPGLQLLAVAGNNRSAHRKLLAVAADTGTRVYGFTDQMSVFMAASDVIVGKAGPSTIMEARAMVRPFVVVDEVGHQERGNAEFVTRNGLGIRARTLKQAVGAVELLMKPDQYQRFANTIESSLRDTNRDQLALVLLKELDLS